MQINTGKRVHKKLYLTCTASAFSRSSFVSLIETMRGERKGERQIKKGKRRFVGLGMDGEQRETGR
jgi:hypothetical protein